MYTEDIMSVSAAERLALPRRLWDDFAEGDVPLTIDSGGDGPRL
jgi:hypothetical protein